jgi:hypothetical protein
LKHLHLMRLFQPLVTLFTPGFMPGASPPASPASCFSADLVDAVNLLDRISTTKPRKKQKHPFNRMFLS